MVDEETFLTALNKDPLNFSLRLVFADWLEEQGDPRAAGFRWLGENKKTPYDWSKNPAESRKTFDWYIEDWRSVSDWMESHPPVPTINHPCSPELIHCCLPRKFQRALFAGNTFVSIEERAARIERVFRDYLDHVISHVDQTRIRDRYTEEYELPSEHFMRRIEINADVTEQQADDFRRQLTAAVANAVLHGRTLRPDSFGKLKQALFHWVDFPTRQEAELTFCEVFKNVS